MTFRKTKIDLMQIPRCTLRFAMGKVSSIHYKNRSFLCKYLLGLRHKMHVKISYRSLEARHGSKTHMNIEVQV